MRGDIVVPSQKWLKTYKDKQNFLTCTNDLNAYFVADDIADKKLDRLSIGIVSLPTGSVIICDPLAYLDINSTPFFQKIKPGDYEVILAVVKPTDGDCARYAAARVRFTDTEAVRYIEALTGEEDLSEVRKSGDGFGFPVEAGLSCICDLQTRDAFLTFEKEWRNKAGETANLYVDYFSELMASNYMNYPLYQRDGGDWLNWQIPDTTLKIPIFASGFGDGYYPVWFGYDKDDNICSLVVQFIDIEAAYA